MLCLTRNIEYFIVFTLLPEVISCVLIVDLFSFTTQDSVIKILDTLYRDRTYARFFVLETIARVPYFGKCFYL